MVFEEKLPATLIRNFQHSQEVLLENVDTAHKAFYESAWNAMNENAVTKAKQLYTSCMNEGEY